MQRSETHFLLGDNAFWRIDRGWMRPGPLWSSFVPYFSAELWLGKSFRWTELECKSFLLRAVISSARITSLWCLWCRIDRWVNQFRGLWRTIYRVTWRVWNWSLLFSWRQTVFWPTGLWSQRENSTHLSNNRTLKRKSPDNCLSMGLDQTLLHGSQNQASLFCWKICWRRIACFFCKLSSRVSSSIAKAKSNQACTLLHTVASRNYSGSLCIF